MDNSRNNLTNNSNWLFLVIPKNGLHIGDTSFYFVWPAKYLKSWQKWNIFFIFANENGFSFPLLDSKYANHSVFCSIKSASLYKWVFRVDNHLISPFTIIKSFSCWFNSEINILRSCCYWLTNNCLISRIDDVKNFLLLWFNELTIDK